MLADRPLFIEGTANFLCSTPNWSSRYVLGQHERVLDIIRCFTASGEGKYGEGFLPLNIEPTAPSFENMLVPVPVVFSPAAGYVSTGISRLIDAAGDSE